MANEEQVAILKHSVETWNKWREENPSIRIDLTQADFLGANLRSLDFYEADFSGAKLIGVNFSHARLTGSRLLGSYAK